MSFSAVLLTGGESKRMGRNKALLPWGGVALWRHQLETLRALHPAELIISTRAAQGFEDSGALVLPDEQPGLGPLGGLAAALAHIRTDWLIVLAVDLPQMTPDYLAALLKKAADWGTGIVPESDGWFEPLAAVYPCGCASLAHELLAGQDRSLQHFVRRAMEHHFVTPISLTADERSLFRNINAPDDL